MRLKIIFTVGMFISGFSYSQKTITADTLNSVNRYAEPKSLSGVQYQKLSPDQEVQIQKKIDQIDSHIEAINKKREFVSNDPEQDRIAIEGGWYEDMNNTILSLEESKKGLIETLSRNSEIKEK